MALPGLRAQNHAASRLRTCAWLVILALSGLGLGWTALVILGSARRDHAILTGWHRADAEVLTARALSLSGRGGHPYHLTLRATDTQGHTVLGATTFPHRVTQSWSKPAAVPGPGDRIAVFLDPGDPARMRPAGSLDWPIGKAIVGLLCGLCSFVSVLLLWQLILVRRMGPPHAPRPAGQP